MKHIFCLYRITERDTILFQSLIVVFATFLILAKMPNDPTTQRPNDPTSDDRGSGSLPASATSVADSTVGRISDHSFFQVDQPTSAADCHHRGADWEENGKLVEERGDYT